MLKTDKLDKRWHLSKTPKGSEVTDFELLLWQVHNSFLRWQEDCEKSINNNDLSGNDLSVLHVIRIMNRPKSIPEISKLLNRDDSFNIQYSIKKLIKLGLIEKAKPSTWQITKAGIKNTDDFAKARNDVLIELFNQEAGINLPEFIKGLARIRHIYEKASIAVIYSYNDEKLK